MESEHKNTYTDLFSRLGNKPESASDNDPDIIERFADELYVPLFIFLFYFIYLNLYLPLVQVIAKANKFQQNHTVKKL